MTSLGHKLDPTSNANAKEANKTEWRNQITLIDQNETFKSITDPRQTSMLGNWDDIVHDEDNKATHPKQTTYIANQTLIYSRQKGNMF